MTTNPNHSPYKHRFYNPPLGGFFHALAETTVFRAFKWVMERKSRRSGNLHTLASESECSRGNLPALCVFTS